MPWVPGTGETLAEFMASGSALAQLWMLQVIRLNQQVKDLSLSPLSLSRFLSTHNLSSCLSNKIKANDGGRGTSKAHYCFIFAALTLAPTQPEQELLQVTKLYG